MDSARVNVYMRRERRRRRGKAVGKDEGIEDVFFASVYKLTTCSGGGGVGGLE